MTGAVLVTRTGIECPSFQGFSGPDEAPRDAGQGSTGPHDASGRVPTQLDVKRLPSAVPSFMEACAKLAGEAAARGDFDRARALIVKAGQAAALADTAEVGS
jgi:hypothetical protein